MPVPARGHLQQSKPVPEHHMRWDQLTNFCPQLATRAHPPSHEWSLQCPEQDDPPKLQYTERNHVAAGKRVYRKWPALVSYHKEWGVGALRRRRNLEIAMLQERAGKHVHQLILTIMQIYTYSTSDINLVGLSPSLHVSLQQDLLLCLFVAGNRVVNDCLGLSSSNRFIGLKGGEEIIAEKS